MNWFLLYDGKQIGPVGIAEAQNHAKSNPNGYAWREGMSGWLPIAKIAELNPSAPAGFPPPAPRVALADEVDYKIIGTEMQFVEIELDPGESVIAEAGAMMYKESVISMDTIFGDGSTRSGQGGFWDKLAGAGKRLLTGESLFMTVYTHRGNQGKAKVAFAAPYPGNIIPVILSQSGGMLICQKDSFLCAARGVSISIFFQKKILTGLFGGEGFIMQKLEGDGLVFLHAGGTIVERRLDPGEILHVDTGCIVSFEPSVEFDIQQAGNIKTAIFGGEGFFFAVLKGPGKVWLQSLPFSRLAGRMLSSAPKAGGSKDEGSLLGKAVLGGSLLGGILGGDEDD